MQENELDELAIESPTEQPGEPVNILDNMSEEDRQKYLIDKMKLKNKIMRYKELFPHLLQNFTYRIEDLDKLETNELTYLLEELSIAVNTRNSAGLTKMLFFETIRVSEIAGKFIGLKLDGLQTALKENQAIHDVLNELSLKYESDMYMSPEVRLAYLTSSTILQLHKLNSSKSVINNLLDEKVPEPIKKQFSDL